jgi:hypothetical protein
VSTGFSRLDLKNSFILSSGTLKTERKLTASRRHSSTKGTPRDFSRHSDALANPAVYRDVANFL